MKRFRTFLIAFVLTVIACGVIGLGILYITAPSHYTVLVIGSDQRGTERARSDVLFLVSIPKSGSQQPLFLTIPRDTKVEDETYGLQKMTHFYALGERSEDRPELGNGALTAQEVEELLDVKIDGTVEVTFESFQQLIDDLGGATINGKKVDGEAALAAVRDRFTEGRSDFDRQADAREVLRSLMTKVKTPDAAQQLLAFFEETPQAHLQLNKRKLTHFLIGAGIARRGNVTIGEIQEEALPGVSDRIYTPDFGKELYYWVVDEEAAKELLKTYYDGAN